VGNPHRLEGGSVVLDVKPHLMRFRTWALDRFTNAALPIGRRDRNDLNRTN
jgi:hypothetical protein